MKKIIGLGNALVDIMTPLKNDSLLAQIDFPKGSMQLVDKDKSDEILDLTKAIESRLTSGGSAANTIHGVARLGMAATFLGKIGEDDLGEVFKEDLEKSGIVPQLIKGNQPTGRAIAMVSPDSERTFATYLGSAADLMAEELNETMFAGHDILHIEGYLVYNEPLIECALQLAKNQGLIVSLDLASFNVVEDKLDFLKHITKEYVDIVFANEEEAAAFTAAKDPKVALEQIAEMVEVAIVKIGKKGSFIKTRGKIYTIAPIDAKARDTTGAGDLYAAGFLYAFAKGWDMPTAGKIASLLAGNVIQVLGAQMSDKRWEKILEEVQNV